MGNEATCRVRLGKQVVAGKALLETTELVFRPATKGALRLAIQFTEMTRCAAKDGALEVKFPGGTAVFADLGPLAEKWAKKIANPPSLLDKLGVKPGMRVALVTLADAAAPPGFRADLARRGADVADGKPRAATDVLLFGAERTADLARLATLKTHLAPSGALWVIRPKGVTAITERDVLTQARAAGLVDVKVAAFSPTHTAEKLVIPVAKR